MDNLLEYCFLKACKKSVKSIDLPMLVSNFFKNHLITACPSDKNIDIKKSRYKKLSVFLAEMKARGVINTSITKGVETLLSVKVIFVHRICVNFSRVLLLSVPSTDRCSVTVRSSSFEGVSRLRRTCKIGTGCLEHNSGFRMLQSDRPCFASIVKIRIRVSTECYDRDAQFHGIR